MSRGIGGKCQKIKENSEVVIYKYSVYNLHNEDLNNFFDGEIFITKGWESKEYF